MALVALAVAAVAGGCAGRTDAGASPGPVTGSADSGFGMSPDTPAPSATRTTPTPAKRTVTTAKASPAPPTKTPQAVPDWADVVEPCPVAGQRVEIQRVLQADVTGDGLVDTMVARTCEASTSYWASTIEVFDGTADPRRPERIGAPLLQERVKEDEPVVTDVSVNAGIIGIKAYGTSPKGTKACPDLTLFYRYEYSGRGFRLIWRDWGTSERCDKLK